MGENDVRAMPSAPATPEPSPAVSSLRGGIGIAAHTPGPWTFSKRGQRVYGGSAQGTKIAQMAIGPSWEANARLIAAAPQMATDLQSAWAVLSIILDNGWVPAEHRAPVEQCRDNATAALSLARGAA